VKKIFSILSFLIAVVLLTFFTIKGFYFAAKIDLEPLAPGVTFDFPVHLFIHGDSSGVSSVKPRLIVTEKAGRIRWVYPDSKKIEGEILDIRYAVYSAGHEEGMLSAAIDPKFPQRPYLYVFYSKDQPKKSRISRFTLSGDFTADPLSELVILEVSKFNDTHNGGLLSFDRDGFLFISIGDSEASNQIGVAMQQRKTLLGTILRIDVSESSPSKPYKIPNNNPFVGRNDGSLPEIWAYGFRNPWRFSYNPGTGTLVAADVGADKREEVNLVEPGGNYGWPIFEGDLCRNIPNLTRCEDAQVVKPLGAFDHALSRAITGAAIYNGKIGSLNGRVVFSDYMRGIFSFEISGDTVNQARIELFKWPTDRGPRTGRTALIASLTQGPDGELYIVNSEGTLSRAREIAFWKRFRAILYSVLNFR
jgi:glucose/arabinose dehydrogenase